MKLNFLHLALVALLSLQPLYSQKNIDPTPEDIELAKKLKAQYKDNDVALLSGNEKVTFILNSNKTGVSVNHNTIENLINISKRADIHKYEFYDSESAINTFEMRFRNGKNAKFVTKDEFYTSNDLFYVDYRVKYMEVDFPVQGYSYTYEMDKKYNDVKYFTTLYFNDEYPVVKKQIEIVVPEWLEIEIREFNLTGYKITKTSRPDAKSNAVIHTFTAEDIPANVKEDALPGPSHMYPHILILAKSFKNNGQKVTLFSSTPDLYKWYNSLVKTIDEKPSELKDKVQELTANAKTDEDKIKSIYYWVQDNIRYIAFEDGLAGFRPDASQNVFKKRYGDCKGMANLIRQMLKEAGFDARLTWIGTRHIAYDYSIPSLGVDNHMICTVIKDGKKYFLDGTEKYNSFGEYAERIQGKQVMIEDGDNFIIEKIPVAAPQTNKEAYNAIFRIEGETLKGKISGSMNGESRASFLYGYNNIKNDKKETALQSFLASGNRNLTINNIKTSDLTNRDKTLTVEYDAILNNKVSVFDNEMYIDLDFFEEYSGLDFKERKNDYEFDYKRDYEYAMTLDIPSGYKVSKLPDPVTADNEAYSIRIGYEQAGNKIVYKKQFVFKKGILKKNDFPNWTDTHTRLKKLYKEQITLTKQD